MTTADPTDPGGHVAEGDDDDDDGSAIAELLQTSREQIDRVEPADLDREVRDGGLVVDIRPAADREADGAMPGAVVLERIHLEWRLDPTSPHRIPEAAADRRVIVMCNEGYASSLAAVTLRSLGVTRATDLAGGYRAWAAQRRADGPGADESPDR